MKTEEERTINNHVQEIAALRAELQRLKLMIARMRPPPLPPRPSPLPQSEQPPPPPPRSARSSPPPPSVPPPSLPPHSAPQLQSSSPQTGPLQMTLLPSSSTESATQTIPRRWQRSKHSRRHRGGYRSYRYNLDDGYNSIINIYYSYSGYY